MGAAESTEDTESATPLQDSLCGLGVLCGFFRPNPVQKIDPKTRDELARGGNESQNERCIELGGGYRRCGTRPHSIRMNLSRRAFADAVPFDEFNPTLRPVILDIRQEWRIEGFE